MFKVPKEDLIELNHVKHPANVLFVFPGIEGNCNAFIKLANYLEKKNIQTYGFEFTRHVPTDSIDSIAKYYIEMIGNKLRELGLTNSKWNLAGYSYGGMIAIEISAQLGPLCVENLFLFESSHDIFRLGGHSNALKFKLRITNESIFKNSVYLGVMSLYLSFMISLTANEALRNSLHEHLMNAKCRNLNDALEKAFDYIESNTTHDFESEEDKNEMKDYLRILVQKSNAGFVYILNGKLRQSIYLFRSRNFLYRKEMDEIFYKDTNDPRVEHKYEFDENDYNLKEICFSPGNQLTVVELEKGNHWTFIEENAEKISQHLEEIILFSLTKAKL
jgi:pimeloyl-ACP methyl ester carboxylesterase